MPEGGSGCGCVLLWCAAVAAMIVLVIVNGISWSQAVAHDDPYFHQALCKVPAGYEVPEPVDITSAGMSRHCVATAGLAVSFTSRLTGRSVTLCLGRAGDCVTGHVSPFPGGRLTLRPGGHQEVTFPSGSWDGSGFDREYPVTVAASPSTPPSPAFDVAVDAKPYEPSVGK